SVRDDPLSAVDTQTERALVRRSARSVRVRRVRARGVGEVEEADLCRQVPPFAYAPTSTETARPTSSHGSPRGTRRSGRSRSLNVLVVCDRQAASTAKR